MVHHMSTLELRSTSYGTLMPMKISHIVGLYLANIMSII